MHVVRLVYYWNSLLGSLDLTVNNVQASESFYKVGNVTSASSCAEHREKTTSCLGVTCNKWKEGIISHSTRFCSSHSTARFLKAAYRCLHSYLMSSSERISRLYLNDKRKTWSECHCAVQNEVNTEVAVAPKKSPAVPSINMSILWWSSSYFVRNNQYNCLISTTFIFSLSL